MSTNSDFKIPSVVHNSFSFLTECLGIIICAIYLRNGDVSSKIKYSLYGCIIFDVIKGGTSFYEIILAFFPPANKTAAKPHIWAEALLGVIGILGSIALIAFYETNYYETDFDTISMRTLYYVMVALYGLMKLTLFGFGSVYMFLYLYGIQNDKYGRVMVEMGSYKIYDRLPIYYAR